MSNLQKTFQSTTLRVIFIGVLALLFLIPTGMIKSVIYNREMNQDSAIQDITSKWGNEQIITGPVLSIPYDLYKTVDGKQIKEIAYAHFLPENLEINSAINPELRSRGIYEAVVYSSDLNFSGSFSAPNFTALGIDSYLIHWDKAFISVGIPDMRGLEERNNLKLNGQTIEFSSGIITDNVIRNFSVYRDLSRGEYQETITKKIFTEENNGGNASGLSANVPKNFLYSKIDFEFDLKLKGSERIAFVPLGKTTSVQMTSNWASPSFDGAFLPDERELSDNGFTSNWYVLDLNRNYPQSWVGGNYNVYDSVLGVSLINPVDGYQKSNRSITYALLIIALTFLIFLSFEIFNRKKIHPVQYILVGLSLVLFYALLISISEILGFNIAYGIASVATIGLIVLYSNIILKEKRFVAIQGGILVFLYAFVYILLQLEDYALFIGSVGLFVILAIIMYLSRKVDWYSLDNRNDDSQTKIF